MKASICILSDGRPGHVNQSQGLLQEEARKGTPMQTFALPRLRKALKHPALMLAFFFRTRPTIQFLAYRLGYGSPPPQAGNPLLIVSTGGDTLLANITLSRLYGSPNVFVGKRSRHTDAGVRLLATTTGEPVTDKVMVMDFAPVSVGKCAPEHRPAPRRLIAVMIGGDSNEYRYDESDFRALATSLDRICQRHDVTLLLTTSRRTGSHGESVLRARLPSEHLSNVTWYSQNPAPVAKDYCEQADVIFCSEDSGTMLTEAISYGKPVVAFYPKQKKIPPFYEAFLRKMQQSNVIASSIDELGEIGLQELAPAKKPDLGPVFDAIAALTSEKKN